jgi:hypothetical protein
MLDTSARLRDENIEMAAVRLAELVKDDSEVRNMDLKYTRDFCKVLSKERLVP